MKKILQLNSSSQHISKTRKLSDLWIDQLFDKGDVVVQRDLTGLPIINGDWMVANYTPDNELTVEQHRILELSNQLIEEVQSVDILVIGAPVYNFGIPVALKAWIDLIARAKKTFRYTEEGSEGLLMNKKVYVIYASGGTPMGADYEFVTPYLRHILSFLGLTDIQFIDGNNNQLPELNQLKSVS